MAHYQCYALAFWQGGQSIHRLPATQCSFFSESGVSPHSLRPFQLLPFEYPPLTLSVFSLALLAPLAWYAVAFAFLMALVALLIYWLLQRYGPRGAALACAFYLVLGAWGTAEGRFDLIPAGLTLLCLLAAERRRWLLAYSMLALGFLFKIYPLLLLPALFIAEQSALKRFHRPPARLKPGAWPGELWLTLRGAVHWRWRHMLYFWGVILAVSGLFALINFQGAVLSQWSYFSNRPVQVEATGSTALWLATLFGHPVVIVKSFGSVNIISNLGHRVALISEAFFVLGYALVILQQWRGKLDLAQSFIAALLVFIVTGKVFSPQYLIWLIPLLAYNGFFNRLWLVLWGSISLLTTAIFPYMYSLSQGLHRHAYVGDFIALVTLRNLLLLLVTLAVLFNWWRINQRKAPARTQQQREKAHRLGHSVLWSKNVV